MWSWQDEEEGQNNKLHVSRDKCKCKQTNNSAIIRMMQQKAQIQPCILNWQLTLYTAVRLSLEKRKNRKMEFSLEESVT